MRRPISMAAWLMRFQLLGDFASEEIGCGIGAHLCEIDLSRDAPIIGREKFAHRLDFVAGISETFSGKGQRVAGAFASNRKSSAPLVENPDPAFRLDGWRDRGCVGRTCVLPAHDRKRRLHVAHRPRDHTFRNKSAIYVGMGRALRNKAARRLQPDEPAAGRWNADRARTICRRGPSAPCRRQPPPRPLPKSRRRCV